MKTTGRHVRIAVPGSPLNGNRAVVCREHGDGSVDVEIQTTRGIYYAGETIALQPSEFQYYCEPCVVAGVWIVADQNINGRAICGDCFFNERVA
jgi:hypothetical protein